MIQKMLEEVKELKKQLFSNRYYKDGREANEWSCDLRLIDELFNLYEKIIEEILSE